MAPKFSGSVAATGSPTQLYVGSVNLVCCTIIAGITYGIMFTLYGICTASLVQRLRSIKKDQPKRRRTVYHLLYISIMFILGTLYTDANVRSAQLSYAANSEFPGGATYNDTMWQASFARVGSASYVISNWMGDCLVLWRLIVLYHGSRYRIWVVILSSAIFLGVVVMGVLVIVHSSIIDQPFYSQHAIPYAIPYYALSLALSLIATGLVVSRVYMHKKRLRRALGPGQGSLYTSVIILTVESSGLYALWASIFLVLYIADHPVQYVFLGSLCQVQIIAPLLITFCVSQDKTWAQTKADPTVIATIRFASNGAHSEMGGFELESDETLPSVSLNTVFRGTSAMSVKLPLPPAVVHRI
ncbi:hypothetical protein BV22DRAFT_1125955 [Leucogyrophana mollusca]|uniref:Uncharacterized protein n=1 Tax=Leucogyrophana mollusca TaxID=85980 RepID=A0ACB8BUI1_9AGAM|nr:hypothetical protein BV22DRAFT_1125955 [Leucogyrophana mollusca]